MTFKAAPVKYDTIICAGGLDLVTPTLNLKAGVASNAINFECATTGGYARTKGYERLDGRPSPSAAIFLVLNITGTTIPALGSTITGDTSAATGVLIAQTATTFVLTKVTGTFSGTEVLKVSGAPVATQTGFGGATTQKMLAQYKALAADIYRADIGAPAGSGGVLGAFLYKDVKYCFKNNAGGTAAVMFKATSSGWTSISLGRELPFGPLTGTITVTIAAPGVVTWTNHALTNGTAVTFSTTGALPTGITANTTYYVVSAAANTFQLAATVGGASITTTGSQSGVHTATAMSVQIADGATVTGKVSGATAVVARAVLSGGAWAAQNPFGRLIFATVTGAFQSGEMLTVGGTATVQTTAVDSAITLLPGGKFDFEETNFAGSSKTTRIYGCDGVNRGFEWDGTTFVPIATGTPTDTPTFVAAHKKHLFWAFGSSLIHSAPGLPYDYTALSGASELPTGDVVTGMLVQPGAQTTGAMVVFNNSNTLMLYGTGVSTWNLVAFNTGTGAIAWSPQNMSQSYTLDNRGVFGLTPTLNYGNFEQNTLTAHIQPLIARLRSTTTASTLCREKSQYRVYFSNGMGLHVTIVNGQFLGAMPVWFPIAGGVNNAFQGVLSTGEEVILLSGADGYVYQAEKGTSFDGAAIQASITLHYEAVGSPRVLKRFRKCAVEMIGSSYAEVQFSYSLGYGKNDPSQPDSALYSADLFSSAWDVSTWDQFFWDSAGISPTECEMGGTAENVALTFVSTGTYFDTFTINSAIVHYSPRRGLR